MLWRKLPHATYHPVSGGLGDEPYCAPNPCGSQPFSCSCAGELCTYGYCANANTETVFCECPNC